MAGNVGNESVLSWSGFQSNLRFNETQNFLYESEVENIDPNNTFGNEIKSFLIPHGLCKIYKIIPIKYFRVKLTTTKQTNLYFLFVSDPAATTNFQLPYSLLTGDKIRMTATVVPRYFMYNIKLKETTEKAEDVSCVDYPYNTHESYSDCVDADLRDKILPRLGCMVPWISDNDACVGLVHVEPKHKDLVEWLHSLVLSSWGGIQYKSAICPLPCTLLSAHATFQISGTGGKTLGTINYILTL